jgi:cold shock CspA family protein
MQTQEEAQYVRVRDFKTLADRVADEMDKDQPTVSLSAGSVAQFPGRAQLKTQVKPRTEGSIRKIKQDRGYGFIAGDDGVDYFFHWSAMDRASKNFRELSVQERVSFEAVHITDTTTNESKYRAIKIRVVE